jgi:arylsulfatase A-like enzyme
LFTGKDPFQHGAHRVKDESKRVIKNALPPHHLTLSEMFFLEGYKTGAVVANDVFLGADWKLNRGYETYQASLAYGDTINERVYTWLDEYKDNPFMLFINYMDAHKPYNPKPQPEFMTEPVNPDLDLPIRAMEMVQKRQLLPESLIGQLVDQYDLGIRNLDVYVGELLDHLKKNGLYDNTVIVLTSDHGETFAEHDFVLHGNDVYEPEVWVPLIVKGPGQREGERIEQVVGGSDVPRLIMAHLAPEIAVNYEAEFPNAPGNHPVITENYYSYKQMMISRWKYDRIRTAIYEWPYKYIHSSKGASELYNLVEDPGEQRDLLLNEPAVAERLLARLEAYQSERGRAEDVADAPTLTDKQIEKLKSLGYVGN